MSVDTLIVGGQVVDGTGVPGRRGDVVIFDPNEIGDRATLEQARLTAQGIERVLVNGRTIYRNGTITGELPGSTIRRRAPA